jgi:hypothetical protein
VYRAADNPEQGRTRVPAIYLALSPLFRDPAQVKQMRANDIAFYMGWVAARRHQLGGQWQAILVVPDL